MEVVANNDRDDDAEHRRTRPEKWKHCYSPIQPTQSPLRRLLPKSDRTEEVFLQVVVVCHTDYRFLPNWKRLPQTEISTKIVTLMLVVLLIIYQSNVGTTTTVLTGTITVKGVDHLPRIRICICKPVLLRSQGNYWAVRRMLIVAVMRIATPPKLQLPPPVTTTRRTPTSEE